MAALTITIVTVITVRVIFTVLGMVRFIMVAAGSATTWFTRRATPRSLSAAIVAPAMSSVAVAMMEAAARLLEHPARIITLHVVFQVSRIPVHQRAAVRVLLPAGRTGRQLPARLRAQAQAQDL